MSVRIIFDFGPGIRPAYYNGAILMRPGMDKGSVVLFGVSLNLVLNFPGTGNNRHRAGSQLVFRMRRLSSIN